MQTDRPVRVINTRAEEFQASRPRVPTKVSMRMSARKDGTLLSKESHLVADNGSQPTSVAFLRACSCQGVRQAFTSYGNPKGNADTDRAIRTMKEKLS